MNLVFGTDGKVYIQTPLWWNKSYNTWIWGDYDPETGIVSVPVGQYLMYNEYADMGAQLLWGHSILYQNEEGYYMYEYFIDDVDEILYKIDGDNLYLLGCEGDPNADFPEEDPSSSVNEMNAGKQVANVRYFNLAGQEMAQPSGMTIQVTTFTDGTRTATKVMK